MDSGNSGSASLQSSSGGGDDEDYASRPHSFISSFFNSSAAAAFTSTSNLSPPSLPGSTPPLFDPASTYHSQQPNSLLGIDLLRSSTLAAANCTDLASFSATQQQPTSFGQPRSVFPGNCGAEVGKLPTSPSPDHHGGGGNNQATLGVRNSKKRTRASRRAPTTVLTTDTHNFRAMVQEFTGIPAPPFSASRRLDLFGTSALRSSLYPLRPSPHKFHSAANPFGSSSPSLPAAANFSSSGPDGNYLNTQNPIESFHSLLQQPHQHKILSSLEDRIQLGMAQTGETHHQLSAEWRNGGSTQHQSRASDDAGYNNSSSALEHRRISVGKFNFSDHAPATGDGTVDSWICPSD